MIGALLTAGLILAGCGCAPEPAAPDDDATPDAEVKADGEVIPDGDVPGDAPDDIGDGKDVGPDKAEPEDVDVTDLPPEQVELDGDDGGDGGSDACALPCDNDADCKGKFPAEDACHVATCKFNQACKDQNIAQGNPGASANQCELVVIAPPNCCVKDVECKDMDDNVCTINEHCNEVENVCAFEYDKDNPECWTNVVLFSESFNDVPVPPGKCVQPQPMKYFDEDQYADNAVAVCVADGPMGTGQALYIGDPKNKTYYDGSFYNGVPVAGIECEVEQEDVQCPPPLYKCDAQTKTCKPELAPGGIKQSIRLEEMVLPDNSFVSLSFRLWNETEKPTEDLKWYFDIMEVSVSLNGVFQKIVYDTKPLNGLSGEEKLPGVAEGVVVAADLSQWAGQSIDIEWAFDTVDGMGNVFEGIYLDDIRVATYSSTCQAGGGNTCLDESSCTRDECVEFSNSANKEGFCLNDAYDAFCTECPGGLSDCVGAGPYPEDPVCWPPTCGPVDGWVEGVEYCQWLPNPACCTPDDLDVYYDEGFESGTETSGLAFDDPTGGVGWQIVDGIGAEDDLDPDTFGLYFGDPSGWTYDCGLDLCEGCVTTGLVDLTDIAPQAFAKLTFQLKMATEWDQYEPEDYIPDLGVDTLSLLAVKPDDSEVPLWDSDAIKGTTQGLITPVWVALAPVVGENVRLKFCFSTGVVDVPLNDFWGVMVDEIVVESVCESVCSVDSDCPDPGDCFQAKCTGGSCHSEQIPECCTAEINTECDDEDPCTDDSCAVDEKLCVHTPGGDPACCTPKPQVAQQQLDTGDLAANGWTVLDTACWIEPVTQKPDGTCNTEDGETCGTCPTECGACKARWQVVDHDAFSLPTSLFFGNADTWTYENQVGQKTAAAFGRVAGPTVTLPPYGTALFSFKLKLETEHCQACQNFQAPAPYDEVRVLVQTTNKIDTPTWKYVLVSNVPAVVWNSVYDWDFNGCTADAACNAIWKQVTVDTKGLNLTGKYVRFVLEFDSHDEFSNAFGGAYLDDFVISTACDPLPECSTGFDCAEASPEAPDCTIEKCKNGKCDVGTNPNVVECSQTVEIAAYDFDGGTCTMDGWSDLSLGGTQVKWQSDQAQNYTPNGKCSLYFGNPVKKNYACPAGAKSVTSVVRSPELDVTGHEKDIKLRFWLWQDLDDQTYFLDKFWLQVDQLIMEGMPLEAPVAIWSKPCSPLDDSGECAPDDPGLYCVTWGCDGLFDGQWTEYVVDVDLDEAVQLGGGWISGTHVVVFELGFDSADCKGNSGAGLFVDDFRVGYTKPAE